MPQTHSFPWYNSVVCNISTKLYHSLNPEHFHHSQRNLVLTRSYSPFFPFSSLSPPIYFQFPMWPFHADGISPRVAFCDELHPPLYCWILFCCTVHCILMVHLPVDEQLGCFPFLAVVIQAAMSFMYKALWGTCVSVSLGPMVRSGFLCHMVTLCLAFWKTVFQSNHAILHSYQQRRRCWFLWILLNTC
jgi:hypothetical protein